MKNAKKSLLLFEKIQKHLKCPALGDSHLMQAGGRLLVGPMMTALLRLLLLPLPQVDVAAPGPAEGQAGAGEALGGAAAASPPDPGSRSFRPAPSRAGSCRRRNLKAVFFFKS